MGLREIKDRARRALHKAMQVPAYYYAPGSKVPKPINVRVHNQWNGIGDIQGTSFRFAQHRESIDELVFLVDEVGEAVNKAIVMISPTEGYRVNTTDPIYLQTQTAKVTTLSERELAQYPSPPVAVIAGDLTMPFLDGTPPNIFLPYIEVDGDVILFVTLGGDIVLPFME